MADYKDPNLDIEERIKSLISQMTLKEKVRQLDIYSGMELRADAGDVNSGFKNGLPEFEDTYFKEKYGDLGVGCVQERYSHPSIINKMQRAQIENSRLGIPLLFSEETLHGLLWPEATILPQQIAVAATFEPEIAFKQGRVIASEARSLGIHEGWAPVLDLARDPRFGRVEEGFGEDTFLGAQLAYSMVKGYQLDDLTRNDTVVSEVKHFTGYGFPYGGLNCAPALFGRRDHAFYALPIFEAAFKAGALNTMCSYNSIDGIPVAGDRELLTDVLRGDMKMQGFVRSDMTAIIMLQRCHYVAETNREAIKMGITAGVDMQLYDFPHDEYQDTLIDLVLSGNLDEEIINLSVSRVLRVKFLLGLFENPYVDENLHKTVVNCDEHKSTALEIAKKAIVLLKNKADILPLSKNTKKIAVMGPSADTCRFGDYSSASSVKRACTLLDGIKEIVGSDTEVLFSKGCSILDSDITPVPSHWFKTPEGAVGLKGEYFNNCDCSGEADFTRTDSLINFNFIYSKPAPNISAQCFSARWTGVLKPTDTFNGSLGLSSMDSMRLWVDDVLLVDGWGDKDANQMQDFSFERGKEYKLKIEFFNDQRGVRVLFGYNYGSFDVSEAVALAKNADVAIVALGDSEITCGENLDRSSLSLPGKQLELLKAVAATKTPTILVLQNGRPLTLTWENENIDGIVEAFHIGEQGGRAIAQVLFGDYNPAGRLPISFPKSVGQIPVNYNRCPFGATKYVEEDWNPLYPFGFGLSYTSFDYSNLSFSSEKINAGENIVVSFDIKNIGNLDGEEVAQVYLHDRFSCVIRPYKELCGFTRVFIKKGETVGVNITIKPESMRVLDRDMQWKIEKGDFDIFVGNSSSNECLRGSFAVL